MSNEQTSPSIIQTIYTPSTLSGTNFNSTQTTTLTGNQSLSTPLIVSNKSISNQTIALAHILQKRNFTNSIKTVNQKFSPQNKDLTKRSNKK